MLLALLAPACDRPRPGDDAGTPRTLHFLIPGSPGGGWDLTARTTGESLRRTGLIQKASYENLSGGGGGRAIAHLVETSRAQHDTVMVASSTMLIQTLRGLSPIPLSELTPITSLIGDYGAFVVRFDSRWTSWQQVLEVLRSDPSRIKIGGGSVPGSLDHVVALLALREAEIDPAVVAYVPYDTGGKALGGLLAGEIDLLSTGLGESLEPMRARQARILAITAPNPISQAPGVPTLRQLGYDVEFVNWRGFFGAPTLPEHRADQYAVLFSRLSETDVWRDELARHGWERLCRSREDFEIFLDEQVEELEEMLISLGRPPRG